MVLPPSHFIIKKNMVNVKKIIKRFKFFIKTKQNFQCTINVELIKGDKKDD